MVFDAHQLYRKLIRYTWTVNDNEQTDTQVAFLFCVLSVLSMLFNLEFEWREFKNLHEI